MQFASIEAYVRQVNGGPRQLTRTEREIIDNYAAMIVDDIEQAWPVDTSTSRDAWTYEVRGQANWMGFVIENDVDYVEWVHYAGQPATPPLWETLLPATVQAYAAQMLAALRAEILISQRAIDKSRAVGGGLNTVLQKSRAWIRRAAA